MNKFLLSITSASMIALTGVSVTIINQPSIHASTMSFPKEVQGKWTNQSRDSFKIKGSKATLNITNGKKKGTYKFKLKSKIDEGYKLKADGKKLDKTNDYTLSIFQDGTMQFNYGRQTIKLSNGPVNVQKSKDATPAQNVQQTNNQQPNNQTQAAGDQNAQQNNGNNQSQQNTNHNMPGQDHAPGSNPDGTPDPWVQGQIDWENSHPNEQNTTAQEIQNGQLKDPDTVMDND